MTPTNFSDVAVNGTPKASKKTIGYKSIVVNDIECYVLSQQPLGTYIGQNKIRNTQSLGLMFQDKDLLWHGLRPIRVDVKQTKQWKKCTNNKHVEECRCVNYKCNHNKQGCGMVIRTPRPSPNRNNKSNKELMVGTIPYPSPRPSIVIARSIKQVQPMNRDMKSMPLMKRTDEIGRLIEKSTTKSFLINHDNISRVSKSSEGVIE